MGISTELSFGFKEDINGNVAACGNRIYQAGRKQLRCLDGKESS